MRMLLLTALITVLGCGESRPTQTVVEELRIDCSEKAEAERRRVMDELVAEDFFSRWGIEKGVITCWTGKNWHVLPFEKKQQMTNVYFESCCCTYQSDPFPMVYVRDQFTGKDVATFTRSRGLVLE